MNLPMSAGSPGLAPWVAVDACTLPTADQPLRMAEFDDLFAMALRAIDHQDDSGRARLLLSGENDVVERVQRLADAETACCSFFTFTLTPLPTDADGAILALDIEVPVARADVLAALVQRAEQARRAATA